MIHELVDVPKLIPSSRENERGDNSQFFFGEEQHILFPQIIDMSNMRPEFKYAKEEFRVTISFIQCFISLKVLMN